MDNALRHAGEGAHIVVRLTRSGAGCTLSVAVDGPGVAPDLRSRLSARFVRGTTEGEGCGLGLSIVARIAALSHILPAAVAGLTHGGAALCAEPRPRRLSRPRA